MTREAFIEVLDEKGYSYKLDGNKIVVTYKRYVYLESLETLPPDVVFNNKGNAALGSLETLPPGVEFNNGASVFLDSIETLSPGVEFNNGEDVYLESLKILPPGVKFNNERDVYLESLFRNFFRDWKGNIKGIDSKRLLNKMIESGLFDRR